MPPNGGLHRTAAGASLPPAAGEVESLGSVVIRLVLCVGLVLGLSRLVAACSCIEIPGDPTAPATAFVVDDPNYVVVLGTIEAVRFEGDWPEEYKTFRQAPTIATIQVDRYWGEAKIADHIEVRTENAGPGCGVPWNMGECYLIEAWRPEGSGMWQSSTCSITTKVSTRPQALDRLQVTDGPGKTPRKSNGT